jgi:hypothetical protein
LHINFPSVPQAAHNKWRKAVESIVDEDWLQLEFVDCLRDDAKDEAQADIAAIGDSPVEGDTAKQAKDRKKQALKNAEMAKRDVVFENASLLMLQALLYTDYHDAIRSGDTGRLERSSDILCVMFQGLSKLKNYRYLSLDFKASRVKEWTEEMRELWL